jgi:hypothetical protein
VKIITDNKNLMRHGNAVNAHCRAEFWVATRWTWRLGFQPDTGRFVGLSTRTLENYRYKGPVFVEFMVRPDGPRWADRVKEAFADNGKRPSSQDGARVKRTTASTSHVLKAFIRTDRAPGASAKNKQGDRKTVGAASTVSRLMAAISSGDGGADMVRSLPARRAARHNGPVARGARQCRWPPTRAP